MWDQMVVGLLLLISVLMMLKNFFPRTINAMQQKLATYCAAHGWSKVASWLAPAAATGCGTGCQSCSQNCTVAPAIITTPVPAESVQVVQWRDPVKK